MWWHWFWTGFVEGGVVQWVAATGVISNIISNTTCPSPRAVVKISNTGYIYVACDGSVIQYKTLPRHWLNSVCVVIHLISSSQTSCISCPIGKYDLNTNSYYMLWLSIR